MNVLPVLPWWAMAFITAALMVLAVLALVRAFPDRRRRAGAFRAAGIVVLLVLAAWRPGIPGAEAKAASSELDVFFVVDTTSSSAAEDYDGRKPRLTGMKADISAMAQELAGARFSLLTFDAATSVKLPLTTDTSALQTSTDILQTEVTLYSHGSSVTAANDALVDRLTAARTAHPERPRVVFYLGDGEQTAAGAPKPFDIPAGLISGGAVLGYGTEAGGKMKNNYGAGSSGKDGYIKDTNGATDAVSVIDEKMLSGIGRQLGVPYVHRNAGDPVSAALAGARSGALKQDGAQAATGRAELYWILALGAFALAVWELLVSGRRLRTLQVQGGMA